LLFNVALEYVIRRVQVKQEGLKLNGNISFWFMLMILCRSIHSLKKNTEDSVVTNEEIGVEVNLDKTKYMVVY